MDILLFDEEPKMQFKDFFERRDYVNAITESVNNRRLIIITGIRRVGKTSLIKTTLFEKIEYSIYIDARYLARVNTISDIEVLKLFRNRIQDFIRNNQSKLKKLISVLKNVNGVKIEGIEISFDLKNPGEVDLHGLFEAINTWAKENNNTKIVLAIDEIQEFNKSKEIDVSAILVYIYENCKNIVLIVTGSEVSLMYDFFQFNNPDGYFYGRSYEELHVLPLDKHQSKQFLKQGFQEIKGKLNDQDNEVIDKAANQLGGVVGWLIKFANLCKNEIDEKQIIKTQKQGSILSRKEFEKFLMKDSDMDEENCKKVMNKLSNPKKYNLKEDILNEHELHECLDYLVEANYIEKLDEERYFCVDPLLTQSFRQ